MSKTRLNPFKKNLNCSDKNYYKNIIQQNKMKYEAEIHAKDEIIKYYQKAAEQATRSKHRALDRRDEHRKDIICWGILIVCIALSIWIAGMAIHEFLLWASGN